MGCQGTQVAQEYSRLLEDYRREAALIEAVGLNSRDRAKHLTPEEIARIRREASAA
jgi:hypothetical protein